MNFRNAKASMLLFVGCAIMSVTTVAQTEMAWIEADRQNLLQNLTRSRDELIAETKGLTKAQAEFKESADRWSINQIVEHIGYWEMLLAHDISRAYNESENAAGEIAPGADSKRIF